MSTTSLHCHLLGTNSKFRVPVNMEQDNVYDLKAAIKDAVPQWFGDVAAPDIEVWAARIPPLANWAVDISAANSLIQNTESLQDGMPLSVPDEFNKDFKPNNIHVVLRRCASCACSSSLCVQLTYRFYYTFPPPWSLQPLQPWPLPIAAIGSASSTLHLCGCTACCP
jgi:hypothetical protein